MRPLSRNFPALCTSHPVSSCRVHECGQGFSAQGNFQPLSSPLPAGGGLRTTFGLQEASWFLPARRLGHSVALICFPVSQPPLAPRPDGRTGGHRSQGRSRLGVEAGHPDRDGSRIRTPGTLTENACSGARHRRGCVTQGICVSKVPQAILWPADSKPISLMFVHPTSIYWPLLFLRCAQGSVWLRGRLWSCGVWDRVWVFHTLAGYFISVVCSSVTITMAKRVASSLQAVTVVCW